MKNEKHLTPSSGYVMLFVLFILLFVMIGGVIFFRNPLFLIMLPFILLFMRGFFTVNPNGSK
ncbi:MAG: SPFH domain-containing protein, partial [Robiginitalea sp.]